jgi:hypothetical protein
MGVSYEALNTRTYPVHELEEVKTDLNGKSPVILEPNKRTPGDKIKCL